ncbi:MAG TPA: helix-hairpin-helix domain-containing protein [Deltaproteobacteria bacterium]|nr:helix-hairpin-helix domain-containing protein [Deltaproteobacteria bacterium]HPJ93572.1 helix-hairpin-helix domain-containing protein [Deltaproteobacteria bacterium]HPR50488.1 helix-hairpin-helix domain-containing protein [Deltaproteobacteria bacterium]
MRRFVVFFVGVTLVVFVFGGMAIGGHGQLNVNMATAEELQLLPGIGETIAQNIIDYRTANGPFRAIDDLVKVKGVGDAKLKNMRDFIKLDGASDYRLTEITSKQGQAQKSKKQ